MYYGNTDPRFTADNLDFQPVSLVFEFLSKLENLYCLNLNLTSKTQAFGWSYLMSGFSSKPVGFKSLLPVDLSLSDRSLAEGYNRPTEETITIISRLIKVNRIPSKVLGALASSGLLTEL